MTQTNIVDQLAARAGASKDRPLHVFSIPESLHAFGVKELGIIEMTLEEELLCAKRSRNDQIRLVAEYAKECLREVDGKAVRMTDGSAERALNSMHPKVRQLLFRAYQQLHQTKPEEDAGFLLSHEVRIG